MEQQLIVTMTKERETARTWRFSEGGPSPLIGSLYVPKAALAEIGDPDVIEVKVTPA